MIVGPDESYVYSIKRPPGDYRTVEEIVIEIYHEGCGHYPKVWCQVNTTESQPKIRFTLEGRWCTGLKAYEQLIAVGFSPEEAIAYLNNLSTRFLFPKHFRLSCHQERHGEFLAHLYREDL